MGSQSYKEGTLVLDPRDSGKKLIWRGWVTHIAGKEKEKIAKQIDAAVAEVPSPFPPSVTEK